MRRNRLGIAIVAVVLTALVVLVSPSPVTAGNGNQGKGDSFQGNLPKNIIVLVSDGWGYNQVLATNFWQYGKDKAQVYEQFPTKLAMSHYMAGGGYDTSLAWSNFNYVKSGATDSAAAATTMATGIKTYGGAIGVDLSQKPITNLMEVAESYGKSTGVVTSVEWSHATPAGFVAHNVSRNNYAEIGAEMINLSACEVIMGCGHPWYDRDGKFKPTPNTYKYVGGEATWNALVAGTAGGDCDGDSIADPWTLIQARSAFQSLATGKTPKRVCGVAQVYQTLQQGRGGNGNAGPFAVPLISTVPTLVEMTKAALNVLDNNEDGFVLMVEAGAVDWACHANQGGRTIEEQVDFNKTVEAVCDWVQKNSNWSETLVVVTGDHETGYLWGPPSGTWSPVKNNGKGNMPGVAYNSGSHTNSLIPFFAKGPIASWFKTVADEKDTRRGDYLDNAELGTLLLKALRDAK